jgi:hypothetical protein
MRPGVIALLNDMPAPLRRDLRGEVIAYEIELCLDRLRPGDTLRIDLRAFQELGGKLRDVTAPIYPHKRWEDYEHGEFCVHRFRLPEVTR